LWNGSRTTPDAYLSIYGLFLFVLATSAAWRLGRRSRRSTMSAPAMFLSAIVLTGLGLSVAVELIAIANDIGRMNTVFKFGFQAWVLWGIGAAVSATMLAAEWRRRWAGKAGQPLRLAAAAWAAGFLALAAASATYPFLATRARWKDRFTPSDGFTLDGQAYMRSARHQERGIQFALAPDLDAIHWLERAIAGTPVIAEGRAPEYTWGSRVSTNTGLPTILGWNWHERQQRAALPAVVVARRAADVDAIYTDLDASRVAATLARYRVEYVYVGDLERIYYPEAGLAKFADHPDRWQRVYQQGGVTIYRVIR